METTWSLTGPWNRKNHWMSPSLNRPLWAESSSNENSWQESSHSGRSWVIFITLRFDGGRKVIFVRWKLPDEKAEDLFEMDWTLGLHNHEIWPLCDSSLRFLNRDVFDFVWTLRQMSHVLLAFVYGKDADFESKKQTFFLVLPGSIQNHVI